MKNNSYKEEFGYDCSEIAKDFSELMKGKGTIYYITGKDGEQLRAREYGYVVSYYYHVVYSYNGMIYDPRYLPVPVTKEAYFKDLSTLNPSGFNVWEIDVIDL